MDGKQKKLKNMDMKAFELPELYLHAPDTDRFQSFLNNSQYVLNLLYNKKTIPLTLQKEVLRKS